VLAGARSDQFFVAQDAVGGAFADGQLEHVHQAAGAETRGFFAGRDDFGGHGLARALRRVVRTTGMVGERIVAVLPPVEPEAHGGTGAFVAPRGGAQAVGLGVAHHFVAQREFILGDTVHGAIESEPGVGLSLQTSASSRGAPGSRFFPTGAGGSGQAPSGPASAARTCCCTHFNPRVPSTRSSIIFSFV
jgi:hypothetical protein